MDDVVFLYARAALWTLWTTEFRVNDGAPLWTIVLHCTSPCTSCHIPVRLDVGAAVEADGRGAISSGRMLAEEDADLFYIAEWAIMAPVPDGWTEHMDNEGNEYYHNSATGVSTYEHPMDDQFRSYYRQVKAQMMGQSLSDSIKQQQQTVAATG